MEKNTLNNLSPSKHVKIDMGNIKKVWVLKKVLELGSLRKASQSLKITPSAVSQNLKSLEETFKQPLIVRHKNGLVSASKEAQQLIERCEVVFSAFDQLNIQMQSKFRIDYIELGVYEALSCYFLPLFFERLKNLFPHLHVKVYTDKNDKLLKFLRQGKICSALLAADSFLLEGFYTEAVFETELGFYISSISSGISLTLEEALEEKKLAMLSAEEEGLPLYMSQFLNQFSKNKNSKKLNPSFIADNYDLIRQVALVNDYIAILPKYIAEKNKGEFQELKPASGELKNKGRHTLFLVSEKYCDRKEAHFLSEQLKAAKTDSLKI